MASFNGRALDDEMLMYADAGGHMANFEGLAPDRALRKISRIMDRPIRRKQLGVTLGPPAK